MFLPLFLILSLFSQDSLTENLHYYPILKIIPEVEVSPFRGEPYTFETTQSFINLDGKSLSFYDVSNQRQIPLPDNFLYHSVPDNIAFENDLKSPPFLLQNLYITLLPPSTSLLSLQGFPVYLALKRFDKKTPFSQIRLFRKKTGSENMQFTFGRSVTRYGRFNISADYLDETARTKRSMGLDTELKLPLNTSSRLLFLALKNDSSYYSYEDKYLCLSLSRKEGYIGFVKKTVGGKDEMGITSDFFLHLPYQRVTVGFDYPDFYSPFYQALLINQINLIPLLYIVPRLAINANKEYTVSLGSGYHPLVDLYLYGNVLRDKDKKIYSSFGLRTRAKKGHFESFIFARNEEPKENSGVVLSYNGGVSSDFYLSSLIVAKISGEPFIYLQPLYQMSFKKGKLQAGIFSGILYPKSDIKYETVVNAGIIVELIDVSLYFVLDNINITEEKTYRFGVQWNFYD